MHGEREEEVNSLFFELAGDLRYSALMKLRNRSYRLSQLAEEHIETFQDLCPQTSSQRVLKENYY